MKNQLVMFKMLYEMGRINKIDAAALEWHSISSIKVNVRFFTKINIAETLLDIISASDIQFGKFMYTKIKVVVK